MKPYRLKHLPTGLYLDNRSKHPQLTEIGKIYVSGNNGLIDGRSLDEILVYIPKKRGLRGYQRVKKADFVKVGVKIEEIPYDENA